MHSFSIGENDAGQRADKFLLKACPQLPKTLLYKAFRKRDVKLNGKRIPAETFLQAGDVLQVYLPDDCFAEKPQKQAAGIHLPSPEIIFEDARIAVIDDESGKQDPAESSGGGRHRGGQDLLHTDGRSGTAEEGFYNRERRARQQSGYLMG